MQRAFPEDYELLAFFGVEPKVLDPKVPWFYNRLDFEVEQDGFIVHCRLWSADGDLSLRLSMSGTELVRLSFRSFDALNLVASAEAEKLVATFDSGQTKDTFSLMLRPHVWFGFGELPTHSSRYRS